MVKQMVLKCLKLPSVKSFQQKTIIIKLDPYIPLRKKIQQIKQEKRVSSVIFFK